MKAFSNSLWGQQYTSALLISTCLILLGIGVWTSHARRTQGFEPHLVNKTNSLLIINSKKTTIGQLDILELVLRNDSKKNIIAFTLLLKPDGVSTTTDYAFSEELLTPGKTVVNHIPLDGLELAAANNISREADVTISAVYFEDHTGDGEPKYVAKIKEKYLGIKDQVQRILPLLYKGLESPSQNLDTVSEIETQAALLTTEDDRPTISADYKGGLRLAKNDLNSKIKKLKSHKDKTNLTDLITFYERVLARF